MKKEIIRQSNITGRWEHKLPNSDKWAHDITNNDNILTITDSNNIDYDNGDIITIYDGIKYHSEILDVSQLVLMDFDMIDDNVITELTEMQDNPEIIAIDESSIDWDIDIDDEIDPMHTAYSNSTIK